MTFNYSCAKELGDVLAGINLCFNIGISGVSGQVTTRNMSLSGTPARTLTYQLYQTRDIAKYGEVSISRAPPSRW